MHERTITENLDIWSGTAAYGLKQAWSIYLECFGTIFGSIKRAKTGGFCRLSLTESLKFA
jgi:hypothetical protein